MRDKVRIVLAIAVVLIVLAGIVAAAVYVLFPAPDPRFKDIPTIYAYANDFAYALPPGYVDLLDEICYEVDNETSCEIAVLVVNTTQPYDINYYALRTFQKNEIGKQGRDNGVLIVVATDDNAWRVEVGYGLMGILTGARVTNLTETYFIPYVDSGDLGDGLVELTTSIGGVIINEYAGETGGRPAYPVSWIPLTTGQWLLFIGIMFVLGVITRGRIFWPLLWILGALTRSGGKFGGGRSGGGGDSGRW